MAWPNDIQSNTPAKYLFKLVSAAETVICNPPPIEWASGTLEIKRDLDVRGVFSHFQADSLTFVGNGAELLRNLFAGCQVNAECALHIYWWKSTTRTYVEFPNSFNINFNFYEIVKVGSFHFGVRVKAINSSVETKLDNRKDIDMIAVPDRLLSINTGLTRAEFLDAVEKHVDIKKPVHLFALDNPATLKDLNRPYINSIDSTAPFLWGLDYRKITNTEVISKRPNDYFDINEVTKGQRQQIEWNVNYLKKFCKNKRG